MKWRCTAWDREGRRIDETIDAPTEHDAREAISHRGLFLSEIESVGGGRRSKSAVGSQAGSSTKAGKAKKAKWKAGKVRMVAMFSRQLAVLVSAGTPLVDALEAVECQVSEGGFKDAVSDIRLRVEEGGTLSDAMAQHVDWFDSVSLSLVAAGESGGQLDVMLQRLGVLTQQQAALRSQLVGAMVYPALLSVVAVCVFFLMTAFVVPRFSGLFETLDVPLPATTAVLMSFSGFLRGYWWAIIPAVLGSIIGGVVWIRSQHGRETLDTALVRVPKLSKMTRSLEVARMSRLLGLLLLSKVPMVEAVDLTRASLNNRHYRDFMDTLRDRIIGGDTLSAVMIQSELIPRGVSQAVRNAEKAGKVGEVLSSLADSMEDDNKVVVKSMTSLLEPLILVVLGLMVGFVTVSMFMPLFDVTAAAGGARP